MDEHVRHHIPLYLDDELQEDERQAFEAHIRCCVSCRAALDRERWLVEQLRQARPCYRAPQELRDQVTSLLRRERRASRRLPQIAVLLAAMVVMGGGALWLALRARPAAPTHPSAFALAAVEAHQRYTRGQLPLDIVSDSPAEISAWFAGRLPFNLKLPNYPEAPGQSKPYEVVGGRLLGFQQNYAAYVVYRLRNRPISLLITAATVAQPSGGEVIPWQGLEFHFAAIHGWKVLTWMDNGLTYVLVSDFEERGQASCIVCHASTYDQRVFK
ncbi:MAG: hypothetical protein KatS3mg131_2661 [Candidatus Tectimicrobiota bacterium]|nr:MAG: hypothetical protein KatS3mg131_2661 [Candidatus Tectomicrobia bacterium]